MHKNRDQKKGKRSNQLVPIVCPSIDVAKLEGLIDLLVMKKVVTEQELSQTADLYQSYINAIIDLLIMKKIIESWELDICIKAYHDFLQAVSSNPTIPPQVLFGQRRNYEAELINLRRKMTSQIASQTDGSDNG